MREGEGGRGKGGRKSVWTKVVDLIAQQAEQEESLS